MYEFLVFFFHSLSGSRIYYCVYAQFIYYYIVHFYHSDFSSTCYFACKRSYFYAHYTILAQSFC